MFSFQQWYDRLNHYAQHSHCTNVKHALQVFEAQTLNVQHILWANRLGGSAEASESELSWVTWMSKKSLFIELCWWEINGEIMFKVIPCSWMGHLHVSIIFPSLFHLHVSIIVPSFPIESTWCFQLALLCHLSPRGAFLRWVGPGAKRRGRWSVKKCCAIYPFL